MRGITPGESSRREDDDRLTFAHAGLVSPPVYGRTVYTTATDPVVKNDVVRQPGVVGRGPIRAQTLRGDAGGGKGRLHCLYF